MNLVVAVAVPADAFGIRQVLYRAWLATYPNTEYGITKNDIEEMFTGYFLPESLALYQKRIEYPDVGSTGLVGRIDDRIVGFCRVSTSLLQNQLHTLYVAPEYHGNGIGTALWNTAQEYLNPLHPTIVEVAIYNSRAIAFYARHGFVDTGRRMFNPALTMKHSGSIIPEMEMRRLPV
ncbi:MAG: hypothetical protein RIQ54_114 [Candidatus Parcubacteria bacterium]|jgi:ribosomal protein S18 acetylase RimI-like enzyme